MPGWSRHFIRNEVLGPLTQFDPASSIEEYELPADLACLLSNIDIHLRLSTRFGPAK
jgi:hypothetical protein